MFELSQQLITEFLTAIKLELVDYMKNEDRNASGKSSASIQLSNVTQSGGQLVGAPYIEFVFRGRGPGKMPPLIEIINWCNARGLPRGVAWVIAKRIAEAGTKLFRQGRNILNEIITEARVQEFTDSLIKIYTAQIKTEIDSLIAA